VAELNILIGDTPDHATEPIPCRYLQIPTIVVQVLQRYFGQTTSRWLPGANHLVWPGPDGIATVEQAEEQFLEIGRLEEYRGDRDTSLPKLLVRRNAVGKREIGIAKATRQGGATTPAGSHGPVSEYNYFGTVVVFAMSRLAGEADFLAAEAEQLLTHYGGEIRNQLGLARFAPTQNDAVGELEEFPEYFAVPVVIDYIYRDNIELLSGRFPIRKIVLEVT